MSDYSDSDVSSQPCPICQESFDVDALEQHASLCGTGFELSLTQDGIELVDAPRKSHKPFVAAVGVDDHRVRLPLVSGDDSTSPVEEKRDVIVIGDSQEMPPSPPSPLSPVSPTIQPPPSPSVSRPVNDSGHDRPRESQIQQSSTEATASLISFIDQQRQSVEDEWLLKIDPAEAHFATMQALVREIQLFIEIGDAAQCQSLVRELARSQLSLKSEHDKSIESYQAIARQSFAEISSRAIIVNNALVRETEERAKLFSQLLEDTETRHRRSREDELSRVRIESMAAHETEVLRLQQSFTSERLTVEYEVTRLTRERQSMQQRIQQLSSSSTFELPEEKIAIETGHFTRIKLTPQKHFTENTATEFHYRLAESQFHRLLSSKARGNYVVKAVEVIVNPTLRARYNKFVEEQKAHRPTECVEHLVFHGTSADVVEKIVVEGFKIGGVDVPQAVGAAHGEGIYSSESPAFAMQYIRDGRTSLLFARVCPTADSKVVRSADQSHIEILVVKNHHQILPNYIVHFEHIDEHQRAHSRSRAAAQLPVFPPLPNAVPYPAPNFNLSFPPSSGTTSSSAALSLAPSPSSSSSSSSSSSQPLSFWKGAVLPTVASFPLASHQSSHAYPPLVQQQLPGPPSPFTAPTLPTVLQPKRSNPPSVRATKRRRRDEY